MTSEIQDAFAHPSARAENTAGAEPLDRISVRDFLTEVEIGAFQSERGVTQRLSFNIVVEVNTHASDAADDVDKILSYDKVTDAIAIELEAERLNLLETLAERIADRILDNEQAIRVFVRIEKLDRGPGALGVEIVRSRNDHRVVFGTKPSAQVRPRLLVLSEQALEHPNLKRWLDQSEKAGSPLLIAVAPADRAGPQVQHKMAQRRIDLLSLDQQAWLLAAQDPRCVVVATRTELDWALENQPIAVWAPSKMILDAVDRPDSLEFKALCGWFAEQMEAVDVISIGAGEIPTAIETCSFECAAELTNLL